MSWLASGGDRSSTMATLPQVAACFDALEREIRGYNTGHLLLNGGKVLGANPPGKVEVVVESGLCRRADI